MGILQDVKALRDKALSVHETRALSTYELTRDAKNNLIVTWADNYQVRIPVIDFRPYQLEARNVLVNEGSKRLLAQWPRRSGKDVTTWNIIIDFAISCPGMYIMGKP